MKRYIFALLFLVTTSLLWAQTLCPKVSPTSGGYATGTGITLSWTMGETYNTTLQQNTTLLTQGEQQPEIDILTGTITGSPFCAGAAVAVPFIARGYYGGANVFTAQLSNGSGSFTSPINIGTLTSTGSGTVAATIPSNTTTGTGYRIRVIANLPRYSGKVNGVNITITSLPSFTAVVTENSACTTSHTASISVTATGGTGTKIYSDNGGSSYQGASLFSALSNGSYVVYVKDANGCLSAPSTKVISTSAGITFTTVVVNATTCAAANGKITVTASGGAGVFNYSKDGGTTWQSSNIFNTLLAGTYSIKVKDPTGCTSAVTPVHVASNTGGCRTMEDGNAISLNANTFNIYPNPASNEATIAFLSDKVDGYAIRMMDVTGKMVFSENITSTIGDNQYMMNLTSIAKGVYMLSLKTGDSIQKAKIVIE